jgi:hypothetical protein
VQLGKKIHMGIELGLPLLTLRAGLYQGYYSYGVGLDLGLVQIEAASWGTELGEYPGQLESRRYMAQLTMRIGFDLGLKPGGGSSSGKAGSGSSGGANGGGSGGGSKGWGNGRKVKQRR